MRWLSSPESSGGGGTTGTNADHKDLFVEGDVPSEDIPPIQQDVEIPAKEPQEGSDDSPDEAAPEADPQE